jgi:HK97 family phage portal protein
MKIFGWDITRRKSLQAPSSGKWYAIHDPYTGAWQQDSSIKLESVLTFSAVYACLRLITSDIGKLPIMLMEQTDSGVWRETHSNAFSPVLRKPNSYQTRIKFVEQWLTSKLVHGNAYILKVRDMRGVVTQMRVLDPTRVEVLVSPQGEAFYRLKQDRMTQVDDVTIPGTEIIHDVHVTPDHPLVGVSPIGACGLTAMQGLSIQRNSEAFFANHALPGGALTAPGAISTETAQRLKDDFQERYSGKNAGKILVAGDGLKFEPFTMTAVDAQMIEQLKWTAEDVCRAFGIPAYKIGVGNPPTFSNMAALNKAYYNDCLQEPIECIELLLDEGLELPSRYRTEFDLDPLLRMDAPTRYEAHDKAIKAGWKSPNEVRLVENLEPVKGGEEPIMQQQNWPLSVLAERAPPDTQPPQASPEEPPEESPEVMELAFRADLIKELEHVRYA